MSDTYKKADDHDLASWHDVVHEVISSLGNKGVELTPEMLYAIYNKLPKQIQNIADMWGMTDTVFCDEAYKWLGKNWPDDIKPLPIPKDICTNTYHEETISDIQEDMYSVLDLLPKDEHGFVNGSVEIKVIVTFKPKLK